ncbi:MAG TPA: hypothetical protein LFW20_06140 [Rickettsia endosymbiont of Omalisus fontisbellaquei]|nr:hypothetical protein [Rickettsia endosymbiont of Omalisus fontisbellaquei]
MSKHDVDIVTPEENDNPIIHSNIDDDLDVIPDGVTYTNIENDDLDIIPARVGYIEDQDLKDIIDKMTAYTASRHINIEENYMERLEFFQPIKMLCYITDDISKDNQYTANKEDYCSKQTNNAIKSLMTAVSNYFSHNSTTTPYFPDSTTFNINALTQDDQSGLIGESYSKDPMEEFLDSLKS